MSAHIEIDIKEYHFYKDEIKKLSEKVINDNKIIEKLNYDNDGLVSIIDGLMDVNLFNRIFRWRTISSYFKSLMKHHSNFK